MSKINLTFICDDNFVIPLSTALTSLQKHKRPETCYTIFIIGAGLKESHTDILRQSASSNMSIQIIKPTSTLLDKITKLNKRHPGRRGTVSSAALLKFELPALLPQCEKVLYLDGDILIQQDLADLFQEQIPEVYAAVVKNSGTIYFNKFPTARIVKNYFNSGVMLLNLKKLREDNISALLFEVKEKLSDQTMLDQNVFNLVFQDKIRLLDIKYNFQYTNLMRSRSQYTLEQLNSFFGSNYASLETIKKVAYIIHFASDDKPYKYVNVPLAAEWHGYYLQSPARKCKLFRSIKL